MLARGTSMKSRRQFTPARKSPPEPYHRQTSLRSLRAVKTILWINLLALTHDCCNHAVKRAVALPSYRRAGSRLNRSGGKRHACKTGLYQYLHCSCCGHPPIQAAARWPVSALKAFALERTADRDTGAADPARIQLDASVAELRSHSRSAQAAVTPRLRQPLRRQILWGAIPSASRTPLTTKRTLQLTET
jgi:hypothetical protein